jgi:copper chaperone CopZ
MEKNCKVELKIEGMTCINCELRIENELNHMDGVVEAKVSYADSSAKVTYDSKIFRLKKFLMQLKSWTITPPCVRRKVAAK